MEFEIGDLVVHPERGAGIVTDIVELSLCDEPKRYYSIKLLGRKRTSVMIPVETAGEIGLRVPVEAGVLEEVLSRDPVILPRDYRKRYELLMEKLQGNILQIAEVVRDLSWRRDEQDGLTEREERLYRRGMRLLASEVAGVGDLDMKGAKAQIRARI